MREHFTEAIVLSVEASNSLDSRVALFTRRLGKLTARVKSSKKITSKLAGHLQPGYVVNARIIDKSGYQVVDALKERAISASPADLYALCSLLAEGEPDFELWGLLAGGIVDPRVPSERDCDFSTNQRFVEIGNKPEDDRMSEGLLWSPVLRVLGWDPHGASCQMCNVAKPQFFSPRIQDFFCAPCASRVAENEVVSVI